MKGLLIKDFLALKQQGKIFLAILAFYGIYCISFDNLGMLVGMVVLICVMMPLTTWAYDEKSRWDKYALSMPVPRKTVVLSKYAFALLTELAGMALVAVFGVALVFYSKEISSEEFFYTLLAVGGIGLGFLSLIIPLLFRFGVEKARFIILLVAFLPSVLLILLQDMGLQGPNPETLRLLSYLSPLFLMVMLWVSYKISLSIYNKKEF